MIFIQILVALAAVGVVAVAGARTTDIGPWYKGLKFPALQPPDWAFGPGWTTIFAFIAASGVVAWNAAGAGDRALMLVLFVLNGVLNVFWSPLFFKLRRPDWALYEWVAFWLSVLALVVLLFQISSLAGWLILPYLAWVSFAGWLNWQVVVLNGPFDRQPSTVAAAPQKSGDDGRVS